MKKGFTLVELLAVFIVLGIIAMITMPIVGNVIQTSKEKTYTKQLEIVKETARTYMTSHSAELPSTSGESKCVSIETLKKEGLLKNEDIKDPKENNKYFNGGILVTYDGVKYTYEYIEKIEECTEKAENPT